MKKLSCKILEIFLICGLMMIVPINVGAEKHNKKKIVAADKTKIKTKNLVRNANNSKKVKNDGSCLIRYNFDFEVDKLERGVAAFIKIRNALKDSKIMFEDDILLYQLIATKSPKDMVVVDLEKIKSKKFEDNLKKSIKLGRSEIESVKDIIDSFFEPILKRLNEGLSLAGAGENEGDSDEFKIVYLNLLRKINMVEKNKKRLNDSVFWSGVEKLLPKFNLRKYSLHNCSGVKLLSKLRPIERGLELN